MNIINSVCPRPVHDVFETVGAILENRKAWRDFDNINNNADSKREETLSKLNEADDKCDATREIALKKTNRMFCSLSRTALAALGTFALYQTGPTLAVVAGTAAVGAFILPTSTLIAAGGYLLYQGTAITITALSIGAFAEIGKGLLLLAAGWLVLDKHDGSFVSYPQWMLKTLTFGLLPVDFVENGIKSLSKSAVAKLDKYSGG
jgi:hypothetical protein